MFRRDRRIDVLPENTRDDIQKFTTNGVYVYRLQMVNKTGKLVILK